MTMPCRKGQKRTLERDFFFFDDDDLLLSWPVTKIGKDEELRMKEAHGVATGSVITLVGRTSYKLHSRTSTYPAWNIALRTGRRFRVFEADLVNWSSLGGTGLAHS
jgi:hypothetical protein